MESKKRTCVKISIWAVLAFSTTTFAAYCMDKEINTSFKIAGIDVCIKVMMHIGYERMWNRVSWGRAK